MAIECEKWCAHVFFLKSSRSQFAVETSGLRLSEYCVTEARPDRGEVEVEVVDSAVVSVGG